MSAPAIAFCGFAASASLAAAVTYVTRRLWSRRRSAIERRLAEPDIPTLSRLESVDDEPVATNWRGRMEQSFTRLIEQTGLDLTPSVAYRIILLSAVALGGGLLVWFDHPMAALVGVAIGIVIPLAILSSIRARRIQLLERQLPDALELLARAVRAGASLEQAITLVGSQLPAPLGTEFGQCAHQLEMGLSVTGAVKGLVRRVPILETRIFATAVVVHRQAGGNLSTTLERLSSVVRDRLNFRRQFRASTAGGRMAAVLMATVAAMVLSYILLWEPDYVQGFLDEPLGWAMLATVFVLQAIGLTWVAILLRSDT